MNVDRLCLLGVGLIGGSVGLAAKRFGVARHVVGVGRDDRNLARAQQLGAIDSFTNSTAEAARDSDFIVVCTPVDRVATDVLEVAKHAPASALITDVGSTKGNILTALAGKLGGTQARFIGSHPLAGSEKRGAANSRADLFTDKLVVVTPEPATDPEATAFIELFWTKLGARTLRMTPQAHDEALAITSHVPHAVASAMAGITPEGWLMLTAGGFRDTTRIAGGDAELWAAIFEANRTAVLNGIEQFQERFAALKQRLQSNDHAGLVQWLAEGKRVRDALGS
jgi:cyclohexadieny/prephenate dehydrogenase